jgi:hypothetical protein
MQTTVASSDRARPVNHPSAEEWMAFLYQELSPAQLRELQAHLAQCADCSTRVSAWRESRERLDAWPLPVTHRRPSQRRPLLQWAAAAALVLGLGVALGRMTSPATGELRDLREAVARLARQADSQPGLVAEPLIAAATQAATAASGKFCAEFATALAEQRAADQQAIHLAIRRLESRINLVQGQVETVAVNTEDTFQQTHRNLVQLIAYALPANGSPSEPFDLEPRPNH